MDKIKDKAIEEVRPPKKVRVRVVAENGHEDYGVFYSKDKEFETDELTAKWLVNLKVVETVL